MPNIGAGLAQGIAPALTQFNETQRQMQNDAFNQNLQTQQLGQNQQRIGMEGQRLALEGQETQGRMALDAQKVKAMQLEVEKQKKLQEHIDFDEETKQMPYREELKEFLGAQGINPDNMTREQYQKNVVDPMVKDPEKMIPIMDKYVSDQEKMLQVKNTDIADLTEKLKKSSDNPSKQKELKQKLDMATTERKEASAHIERMRDQISHLDGSGKVRDAIESNISKNPNYLQDMEKYSPGFGTGLKMLMDAHLGQKALEYVEKQTQTVAQSKGREKGTETGTVANPNPNLTGEAALANYTPRVQTLAKGLADYTIAPPSSFALKDPKSEWNSAIQAAKDLDPTFDMKEYGVRYKLRQSFTSGADSKNINSINTLVGHLDSLNKSASKLDNRGIQVWNALTNKVITATGDSRVTKFNMDLGAVESELAAVFKGTGATDQEIKAWRERINSSQSPEQLQAAITEAVTLMGSRLQALQNKYQQGMGKPADFSMLSPKSRKVLENLVGKDAVDQLDPAKGQEKTQESAKGNIAPKGTVIRLKDGTTKTSDGQGGWN